MTIGLDVLDDERLTSADNEQRVALQGHRWKVGKRTAGERIGSVHPRPASQIQILVALVIDEIYRIRIWRGASRRKDHRLTEDPHGRPDHHSVPVDAHAYSPSAGASTSGSSATSTA